MTGKLFSGEISIPLGDEEVTLTPTLQAATRINRHFGGFQPALNRLTAWDIDAYVWIIRHALGYTTDAQARGLDERVFAAGMLKLTVPLTEYIMVLANGGRPLGDAPDAQEASEPGEAASV